MSHFERIIIYKLIRRFHLLQCHMWATKMNTTLGFFFSQVVLFPCEKNKMVGSRCSISFITVKVTFFFITLIVNECVLFQARAQTTCIDPCFSKLKYFDNSNKGTELLHFSFPPNGFLFIGHISSKQSKNWFTGRSQFKLIMIIIIVLVLVFWRGCKDVSRGEGSSQGGASNSGCNPIPRDSQNPLLVHNCSCLYPTTRSIPIGWLPTYTSFKLPLSGCTR